ncbi:MAG TPA: YbaB/EbfC family nucleoid-associated protein [Micromonosporaceae bacterium]
MLGDDTYLEAADRWVGDWQAKIETRLAGARAAAARLKTIQGTARGAGGLISVTVTSSGALAELHLDEDIRGHSASWIAEQILITARSAVADLSRRAAAIADETVGRDSADGRALLLGFPGAEGTSP